MPTLRQRTSRSCKRAASKSCSFEKKSRKAFTPIESDRNLTDRYFLSFCFRVLSFPLTRLDSHPTIALISFKRPDICLLPADKSPAGGRQWDQFPQMAN